MALGCVVTRPRLCQVGLIDTRGWRNVYIYAFPTTDFTDNLLQPMLITNGQGITPKWLTGMIAQFDFLFDCLYIPFPEVDDIVSQQTFE